MGTAQDEAAEKPTREPVLFLAKNTESRDAAPAADANLAAVAAPRPIDQALEVALRGKAHIAANIRDYKALLVKRERIDGELNEPEFISVKVRNRNSTDGVNVPLSIYMRFLKPKDVCGRECIWVEGREESRIVAHDSGLRGVITVRLDPDGAMAMKGNRYPIYDAGIQNLVDKLIDRAKREGQFDDTEVEFVEGTKINGRTCTLIQVKHPEQRPEYDFYLAQIFIDDELQIPIRYAAYSWPLEEGGEPVLEEEYTYLRLELNVGLTDEDFNPDNPEYEFR
jgi:hypothetical protein